jgi:DNA-directed RNA polymerase specialized sigma24 family protein
LNLKPNLIQLNDIALLEKLCSSDDDTDCYNEFVKRFLPDLTTHCTDVCNKRKLESHIGKQIAHETFSNVRKYKSFKTDGVKLPDDRMAILVYLKRISVNLFNDFHNKNKRRAITHKTYFDDILDGNEEKLNAVGLKDKKEFALFIFDKLNKKEQTVILADIEHKKFQKYLPDDITEDLSIQLNVKKETIRKIRERAIEKIKIAINEFNEN